MLRLPSLLPYLGFQNIDSQACMHLPGRSSVFLGNLISLRENPKDTNMIVPQGNGPTKQTTVKVISQALPEPHKTLSFLRLTPTHEKQRRFTNKNTFNNNNNNNTMNNLSKFRGDNVSMKREHNTRVKREHSENTLKKGAL